MSGKISPRLIATLLWVFSAVVAAELIGEIFRLSPPHYLFVLVFLVGLVILIRINQPRVARVRRSTKQIATGEMPKQLSTGELDQSDSTGSLPGSQPENIHSEPRQWLNDFLRQQQSEE